MATSRPSRCHFVRQCSTTSCESASMMNVCCDCGLLHGLWQFANRPSVRFVPVGGPLTVGGTGRIGDENDAPHPFDVATHTNGVERARPRFRIEAFVEQAPRIR